MKWLVFVLMLWLVFVVLLLSGCAETPEQKKVMNQTHVATKSLEGKKIVTTRVNSNTIDLVAEDGTFVTFYQLSRWQIGAK